MDEVIPFAVIAVLVLCLMYLMWKYMLLAAVCRTQADVIDKQRELIDFQQMRMKYMQ